MFYSGCWETAAWATDDMCICFWTATTNQVASLDIIQNGHHDLGTASNSGSRLLWLITRKLRNQLPHPLNKHVMMMMHLRVALSVLNAQIAIIWPRTEGSVTRKGWLTEYRDSAVKYGVFGVTRLDTSHLNAREITLGNRHQCQSSPKQIKDKMLLVIKCLKMVQRCKQLMKRS